MLNFITKLFIKDHKNIENPRVRNAYGILASIVGIVANLFLSISKIVVGFMVSAIGVIADGINNLSDMASSTVSLIGFKMSNRPADKEHPFGHARIEYLCALIISFIIIVVGLQLIITSVDKIIKGGESKPNILMFCILGASILVKFFLAIFNYFLGKKINSLPIKGVAVDSLNDIIATTGVLVCGIITMYTNINLDGYIGVVVALFVGFTGIKLMLSALSPLIGEQGDPKTAKELALKILDYDGVLALHDFIIHSYGPNKYFVTVHVEVDANVDIMISHELIDTIERELSNDNLSLVIHLDPVITDNERVNDMRTMIATVLNDIDSRLSMHDFRVVFGPNRSNLIFDIVVPNDKKYKTYALHDDIQSRVANIDSSCRVVINIDHNYTAIERK